MSHRSEENEGLHAVASCEVSVDEVFAAEVLHPSGNIRHKLHQHLWREVLKQTQALSYFFLSVQQRAAELTDLRIVVSSSKIQPLILRNTFCVFTHLDVSAFFRNLVLFEPVLLKMAVSFWQIGKNINPAKHPIQQQIKLQIANNDLSVWDAKKHQSPGQWIHAKMNFGHHFADRIHMNC